MPNDTYPISDDFRQRVHAAVAKLRVRGETPSVRLVRAEMGGGSPNWIAVVLREQRATETVLEGQAEPGVEDPELAAARLLVPGLLERLRATIAAEFEGRLNAQQQDLDDARALLREQSFALEDIQAENETLLLQCEHLTRQVERQIEIMTLLTDVAGQVKAIGDQQQHLSERSQEAWLTSRDDSARMSGLLQAQVDTQAEIASGVDAVSASMERLTVSQMASRDSLMAASHAGIDRVLHQVATSADRAEARHAEIVNIGGLVRRRLATITAATTRLRPRRRRS